MQLGLNTNRNFMLAFVLYQEHHTFFKVSDLLLDIYLFQFYMNRLYWYI